MTAFTTFITNCSKCRKKLTVVNWNVIVGMHSLALCPKHLKELVKTLEKFVGEKFVEF